MLTIRDIKIKDAPCLVLETEGMSEKKMPLFIYHHGFQSAREHSLPIGYMLANKGFRVVLPDALHHGARENGIEPFKRSIAFWDIVMKNIEETGSIYNYFTKRNLIKDDKFFVSGTSMGGITTAGALVKYNYITGAGLMMGTAKLTDYADLLADRVRKESNQIRDEDFKAARDMIAPYDLSKQPERLESRPLFIWHGMQDKVIPFEFAEEFYENAKKQYTDQSKITFSPAEGLDHKVNRAAMIQAVDWFAELI